MRITVALGCVVVAAQALVSAVFAFGADCPGWLPGEGVAGVNGSIASMTTWDPDGDGPMPELLVVAGTFTFAGNVAANNIAAWDGHAWTALGTGLTNGTSATSVVSLAVFEGALFAGGAFSTSTPSGTATSIARWNGTEWAPVVNSIAITVSAMCTHQGELVVTGTFDKINGNAVRQIAAYDGASWREFGGGIADGFASVLASDGDTLYVGGKFATAGGTPVNNIAAWNGVSWDNMEFGLLLNTGQAGVLTMSVMGGELIVGGTFAYAGGNPTSNVAIWNGLFWETMAGGLINGVYSIVYYDDSIMVGTSAGLYRWTGWVWLPVAWKAPGVLSCLKEYGGALIAAGGFTDLGPDGYIGIAQWDGVNWKSLSPGLSRAPATLIVQGDLVYAGFSSPPAGTALQAWDGNRWFDPFESGASYWSSVTALGVHQGELVVAGILAPRIGSIPTLGTIARWRSGQWERIGNSGGSTNGTVYAIASIGTNLFVGGDFSSIDSLSRTRIARWDGIGWQSMGGVNGTVRCLGELQGSLIVGGLFSQAGNVQARSIAAWSNPAGFRALGAGLDNTVRSVAVFQGSLIAGGSFSQSGTAVMPGIARWNGTSWTAVSARTSTTVNSMLVDDVGLVAVGTFANIAPGSPRIARWTGSAWAGFGTGIDGAVTNVVRWRNELAVCGSFTTAGGGVSWGFARWSDTGRPSFTKIPKSQDVACGGATGFSVAVASGYSDVVYAWRLNGEVLSPDSNPSATTKTLVIDPVSHASDGVYDCVVTSSCGSVTSPGAVLVSSCCPADLNYDGVVDDADFSIFAHDYDTLLCSAPEARPGCPSDLNRDGFVDDADFTLFLHGYDALECP